MSEFQLFFDNVNIGVVNSLEFRQRPIKLPHNVFKAGTFHALCAEYVVNQETLVQWNFVNSISVQCRDNILQLKFSAIYADINIECFRPFSFSKDPMKMVAVCILYPFFVVREECPDLKILKFQASEFTDEFTNALSASFPSMGDIFIAEQFHSSAKGTTYA